MEMERNIKKSINSYLKKLPGAKFIPYGSIFGEAGTADIIGCIKGCMILIEVKEDKRRESKLQKARRIEWTAAGALWFTVHSVKELKAEFSKNKLQEERKCLLKKRMVPRTTEQ